MYHIICRNTLDDQVFTRSEPGFHCSVEDSQEASDGVKLVSSATVTESLYDLWYDLEPLLCAECRVQSSGSITPFGHPTSSMRAANPWCCLGFHDCILSEASGNTGSNLCRPRCSMTSFEPQLTDWRLRPRAALWVYAPHSNICARCEAKSAVKNAPEAWFVVACKESGVSKDYHSSRRLLKILYWFMIQWYHTGIRFIDSEIHQWKPHVKNLDWRWELTVELEQVFGKWILWYHLYWQTIGLFGIMDIRLKVNWVIYWFF